MAVLARGNGGVYEGNPGRVLAKYGNGRLILGGPGTYTGKTDVQDGILTVRDSNAFGSAATLVYVANLRRRPGTGRQHGGNLNITNKGL